MNNKKITVVIRRADFDKLIAHLHETLDTESMAMGFFKVSESLKHLKVLVRGIRIPNATDYLERSPALVSLQPEFLEECFQYCEENQCHILDVHTHPWSTAPSFSPIDDHQATNVKIPYLREYVSGVSIAFLLFGSNSGQSTGRFWNEENREFCDVARITIQ